MKIDCRGWECPKPVLETKKALESLKEGEILEVFVNEMAPKENVLRFAKSQGCEVQIEEKEDGSVLKIQKSLTCKIESADKKVLFLKSDKIGNGELGAHLMFGFLSTLNELDNVPEKIVCVNEAVNLTCKNEDCIKALENLIKKGVEVYSCGACVKQFEYELKVGKIGDAYFIVKSLMDSEGVVSL